MTLYVMHLSPGVTADDLMRLFAQYGRVAGVEIWAGHNGKSWQRAGVVDMHDGGAAAIAAEHRREHWGHKLNVSESRPWDPT